MTSSIVHLHLPRGERAVEDPVFGLDVGELDLRALVDLALSVDPGLADVELGLELGLDDRVLALRAQDLAEAAAALLAPRSRRTCAGSSCRRSSPVLQSLLGQGRRPGALALVALGRGLGGERRRERWPRSRDREGAEQGLDLEVRADHRESRGLYASLRGIPKSALGLRAATSPRRRRSRGSGRSSGLPPRPRS